MRSIKSRIEYSLIAAALIPALLVAAYVYFTTRDTLETLSLDNSNSHIELLGSAMEETVKHVPGDLFYLRDSNSMHHYGRALVVNDAKAKELHGRSIARDFLSIAKNRRLYNQIRFIGADGKELIRVEHNEKEGTSRILQPELLQDKASSAHFQATTKLGFGDYYISPLDLNREEGQLQQPRPTLRFATPVFAVGERLVGILIMNVDADVFLSMVEQANANESNDTVFAFSNPQGYLAANPDPVYNWGAPADLGHGANLSKLIRTEVVDDILKVQNLKLFDTDDNYITARPVVAAADHSPMGYLVSYAPKSQVLKLLSDFVTAFIVFLVIAAILAVVVARLLSNSLTAPLRHLTDAANRLSKGKIDTEIKIESGDEIQTLAEAFERLRESIKLLMKLG